MTTTGIDIDTIKPAAPLAYGTYANLSSEEKRAIALERIQAYIAAGRATAPGAITKIMSEIPTDRIVRASALTVRAEENGFEFGTQAAGRVGALNDHALGQLAERVRFPGRYLSELRGTDWGRQLIARNLEELAVHRPEKEKFLVREVGGTVRGVLSNGFRPDDSRPALDALIGVAREAGALITSATALDHRVSVKMILGEPVEVFPGEWAVFGLDFRTGDFGGVAREIMGWILRCACLNGAVVSANYRRVHIGGRITDDVDYSTRTRKLNEQFTASATRDIARSLLGAEAVKGQVARIRAANATELDPQKALESIRKAVNKDEEKAIVGKFNSPDVELLPAGNTAWRWSNAISWLATQTTDAERRLDLEKLAGEAMEVKAAG